MFSRRQFLGSSAAAMIVGRAAGAFASASQRGDRGTAETGPLPPSIAALTSMRDQARPITNDERRARIERARQLMAQSKIDALMLAGGTSMSYFANMRWGGSERLFAVVDSGQGRAVFRLPCLRARSRAGADRARPVRRRDSRRPHVAGRREPFMRCRAGAAGPRDCHGTARRRGDRQVRLRRQRGRRRASTEGRERDAGHGRLPDDQGRARNRADATRVSGDAEGVRGRLPRARSRG